MTGSTLNLMINTMTRTMAIAVCRTIMDLLSSDAAFLGSGA
jgi:hypothetical protein